MIEKRFLKEKLPIISKFSDLSTWHSKIGILEPPVDDLSKFSILSLNLIASVVLGVPIRSDSFLKK